MDKIDGNFISIYDDKDKRFHYYVHRLLGEKKINFTVILTTNIKKKVSRWRMQNAPQTGKCGCVI